MDAATMEKVVRLTRVAIQNAKAHGRRWGYKGADTAKSGLDEAFRCLGLNARDAVDFLAENGEFEVKYHGLHCVVYLAGEAPAGGAEDEKAARLFQAAGIQQ